MPVYTGNGKAERHVPPTNQLNLTGMAIVIDNIYTKGISGRVGDSLLYKQYGNKTVVTRFPRLSTCLPSARQLAQRKKFGLAVLNTRHWLQDAAKRRFLLGLKRKWDSLSAYHAGIKYFMTQPDNQAVTTPNALIQNEKQTATNTNAQQLTGTYKVIATTPATSPALPQNQRSKPPRNQ